MSLQRHLSVTLAALALLPMTALAQSRVIEEVIVTAQKREQGLIDVPASVSVIGGELATEAALIDTQDIVQYTPNVKFNSNNAQPTLTIRGFGTPPLGRNIEPSVGVIINDVYYGRVTFANDGAFDMERVEILRGPQGTLFGKNTVSGVINFTTRAPDTEWHGYINAAIGTLKERRLEGGLSFPLLSDRIGARLSFRVRERETGSYNTKLNSRGESEEESIRFKAEWEVSDDSSLAVDYFHTDASVNTFGFAAQEVTERSRAVYLRFDPDFEDDVYDGNESSDVDTFNDRRSESLTLKWLTSWQEIGPLNTLDLAIIANQSDVVSPYVFDPDLSPVRFQRYSTDGPGEGYEQQSLELRFTGDSGAPFGWGNALEFATGLFAFKSESASTFNVDLYYEGAAGVLEAGQGGLPELGAPITALALLAAERATSGDPTANSAKVRSAAGTNKQSLSLFSQFTWYLTDRLDITVGARYGEEDIDGFTGSQSKSQIIAKQIAGQQDFYETYDETEYEFSPKFAASWEVFGDVRLFAVVSKGTKGGGVSGPLLAPIDTTYIKEEALSKEVGIKSFLFDKTLQLNLTAYHVDYDNLQVQAYNGTQLTTLNAAEATGKGFELDFQWLPDWQALTVAGSVGISETAYGDYRCAPGVATQSTADNPAGCSTESPRQDLSGREVPYAPKVSASFYPSLKFPLSDNWGMLVGLDILYQGEHYLDIDLDERSRQEATTKINFRIGLKQRDGGWAFVLNGKNLTGEQERIMFLDAPNNPGNYVARPLPDDPQVSLDIRYSFGE